jgi:hypothetical protein
MFGGTFYLPLFQQTGQGASAQNSGLLLLPMIAGKVALPDLECERPAVQ